MGALQNLLAKVVSRLRDISLSQRIALVLGGALVAISLIALVQWAATPELIPLLPQDLDAEQIAQIQGALVAMDIRSEVRGSQVYVPASANRAGLLAHLQQQEKLPSNTSAGFAALVQESDPWLPGDERTRRWTVGLQRELESVLEQFAGVRDARVFLNLGTQRKSFSRVQPPSSASVTLIMKSGSSVPRPLALATARMVAGAVAGLSERNVAVLDAGGTLALDWEAESDVATQLDRRQVEVEQRYGGRIRQVIPDERALVAVQVQLDTTARTSHTETPLKGQPISEETTFEETNRGRPAEEPGVQPNTGMAVSGGGMNESHTKENTKTDFVTGRETKTQQTPAGEVKEVTTAISLSHTYLEGVFRRMNPDAEGPPTDMEIEEVFQRERARLLSQVVQLVVPREEENVSISRYFDTVAADMLPSGETGTLGEAMDLVKAYGAQSGLGVLALISLLLMLRMARRADEGESFGLELGLPEEAIEAAKMAATDVSVVARGRGGGGAQAAGGAYGGGGVDEAYGAVEQASATEGMLVAQEVDSGTVQIRKMLEQVSEMVESDPDTVSALVEQWMQRSDQFHEEGA